jgi:predicted RNA-binding Zn-ribbon protein involved in translation (DUF1610 family)
MFANKQRQNSKDPDSEYSQYFQQLLAGAASSGWSLDKPGEGWKIEGEKPSDPHGKERKRASADWICPQCGDKQFSRNIECKQCHAPKPPFPICPEQLEDMKEGDWLCPSCGDHQFARNDTCRRCGNQHPQHAKAYLFAKTEAGKEMKEYSERNELLTKVAIGCATDPLLMYNWQSPWRAKAQAGFTNSGKIMPENELGVCKTHGKKRALRNLIDDGAGGMICAIGQECQAAGANWNKEGWTSGAEKGKGKTKWGLEWPEAPDRVPIKSRAASGPYFKPTD